MSPDEARALVATSARVRLAFADDSPKAYGRVIGYSEHPQLMVETADGDHIWWRADMAELVKPLEPERLAALVEDTNGVKYVSVAHPIDGWAAGKRWQRIGGPINTVRNFDWSELDVVRVLAEGWVDEP